MSEAEENLLSKQIKGLTWGIVIAIVGTFGGGACFIVKSYVGIERGLTTNALQYENIKAQQQDIRNNVRNVANRVDMVENKLIMEKYDKSNEPVRN